MTPGRTLGQDDPADPPQLGLGVCSSLSHGFLRGLLKTLRQAPDAPTLTLLEAAPGAVVQAVQTGEIDVGFVFGAPPRHGLVCEQLWRGTPVVLMSEDHPLARMNAVPAAVLRRETARVAHSCEPNCAILAAGRVLVAIRPIAAGDAITFAYQTTESRFTRPFERHCRSGRCRGRVG